MKTQDCIFCKIIAKQAPADIIMETDTLIVIKDLNPVAAIHYLIIPKEHIVDITSMTDQQTQIGADIFACANVLANREKIMNSFKLAINNGYDAGQRVFHLHAHFIAGFGETVLNKTYGI
ncbi:MAG: Hit-family protein [candidate division TM6 bacterium GW2011_GWE2_41_16]|nr:MAG: Hit-family protein [candidate division TM6 bacterium GW2011_GWE2_41_16]